MDTSNNERPTTSSGVHPKWRADEGAMYRIRPWASTSSNASELFSTRRRKRSSLLAKRLLGLAALPLLVAQRQRMADGAVERFHRHVRFRQIVGGAGFHGLTATSSAP
jgi:hypothetical protein